ncbi:hypothetical protein BU26DRAFT_578924, partial [Trematosphaeria pertusa]
TAVWSQPAAASQHPLSNPSPQLLLSSGSLLPFDGENALEPTWYGFVHTARDAAMVVEACLDGTLIQCPRRPYERE